MYITVLCTTKDKEEAKTIAQELVRLKLAACVNIMDHISSVYVWEGKLCDETEALMMIKTKKILFDNVQNTIKTHHSYDNPEIIALPIEQGSKTYLSWIDESTI